MICSRGSLASPASSVEQTAKKITSRVFSGRMAASGGPLPHEGFVDLCSSDSLSESGASGPRPLDLGTPSEGCESEPEGPHPGVHHLQVVCTMPPRGAVMSKVLPATLFTAHVMHPSDRLSIHCHEVVSRPWTGVCGADVSVAAWHL